MISGFVFPGQLGGPGGPVGGPGGHIGGPGGPIVAPVGEWIYLIISNNLYKEMKNI